MTGRQDTVELSAVFPVPDSDGGFAAVLAENADGGGFEGEAAAGVRGEAEPFGGEDAQEMAMGEDGHDAVALAEAGDDAVGTGGDFGNGLAVGDGSFPDGPAGVALADLLLGEAGAVAVIPFLQVGVDDCGGEIAGEFAGAASALERTAKDVIKGTAGEEASDGESFVFALGGEGEIGAAAVLAAARPGGLAMADQPNLKLLHAKESYWAASRISETGGLPRRA